MGYQLMQLTQVTVRAARTDRHYTERLDKPGWIESSRLFGVYCARSDCDTGRMNIGWHHELLSDGRTHMTTALNEGEDGRQMRPASLMRKNAPQATAQCGKVHCLLGTYAQLCYGYYILLSTLELVAGRREAVVSRKRFCLKREI